MYNIKMYQSGAPWFLMTDGSWSKLNMEKDAAEIAAEDVGKYLLAASLIMPNEYFAVVPAV